MGISVEDLRRIDVFAELDDAALGEAAARATERHVGAGEVLVAAGDPPDAFFALLEGALESLLPSERAGDSRDKLHTAPTYLGAIPILTEQRWAVTMRAVGPARVAAFGAEAFRRLMHEHRPVERAVMRTFQPTFQRFEGLARQREKLAALGTMAAGLAHELNNPAAAARRTAAELAEVLVVVQNTIGSFVESGVERDAAERLVHLQRAAVARAADAPRADPLAQAELEDELAGPLEDLGIADPWVVAEPLAAAGVDAAWLAEVQRHAGAATEAAVRWVAATLVAQSLVAELRESTGRISELVSAVKDYSAMDRPGAQEVDVHEGLESTLTMLGHKLKRGSVRVVRDYDRGLPRLRAHGPELNQVWTNLLDNAIDAVDGQGTLTLTTRRAGPRLEVVIADDGPGIPPDIRDRIFEPFFTTKDVGQGTGLGLQTARRIVVDRHGGEIRVDGEPPGTRVLVALPA